MHYKNRIFMPDLNNLFPELPVGRRFAILTKMYFGALTKRLEHLEIERHYSILLLIEKSPDKCTQQYISNMLKIDKASMVRIIDYFVKKKYLKRTVNPNDRREHWMELTGKALKIMPEIHKGISDINKYVVAGLSAKEVKNFHSTIDKVFENLSKAPSDRIIVNYKKAKVQK